MKPIEKADFDVALIPGAREALAAIYRELRRAEDAHFANPAGGDNSAAAEVRERPCPLCAEDDHRELLTAKGMRIVTCCGCGHTYSRDVWTEEFETRKYAGEKTTTYSTYRKVKKHPVFLVAERARNAYYLQFCEAFVTERRLLDVGCGSGSLAATAAARGWAAEGIDPSPAWQEMTGDTGIRPMLGRFPDDIEETRKYDAIMLLDVLEHMLDPADFLRSTRRNLAVGGIVFIQVPNLDSLLIRIEGAANNNFCPGHWSHFDPRGLALIAERCGFEVLLMETVISELDRILAHDPRLVLEKASQLTGFEVENIAVIGVDWLHQHRLGYKLIAILRDCSER